MHKATHALAATFALIVVGCASQSSIEVEAPPAAVEAPIFETLQRVPSPNLSAPPTPQAREDEVVVTGFRSSLARSMEMRRESTTSVDSIAAENVGAFPQPAPGAIDRERYAETELNPIRQVSAEPVSTFSIDVDTASYSNVRRMLAEGRLPPRDSVRIEELINYFDYEYEGPRNRRTPFATHVSMAPSPWAEGRVLMHIGLQGYDVVQAERPPLNLVLLIDVSGSMQSEDKLPLAIQGFRMLAERLTARDRLSIVVYAGRAGAVLEPTSGADRAAINAALARLQAGGSTAGGEGLRLAYALAERNYDRDAVNRVILATDGDFNVGVVDDASLEDFVARKRETGIYLSVLGFGGGNYNDQLMQVLAQNGNGVAAYIDTLAEARRVLSDDLDSNLFPVANDVKIQVEFNPERVAEYRLIGYETRMLRREDFNNDRVDAGEINSGHSVTAIYELTPVGGQTLIDPLRYQGGRTAAAASGAGEFAFLRIRYKLPGQNRSRLIERAITNADLAPDMARASDAARWASAVAGYGQLLRGDPYLAEDYGWDEVAALAESARGRDEDGRRAEFLQLVRSASTASALVAARTQPRR